MSDLMLFNSPCRACCSVKAHAKFCAGRCTEVAPGKVIDPDKEWREVTQPVREPERIGDPEPEQPDLSSLPPRNHLHRKCKKCGFEWLEQCMALGVEAARG